MIQELGLEVGRGSDQKLYELKALSSACILCVRCDYVDYVYVPNAVFFASSS